MSDAVSVLEIARRAYTPQIPVILEGGIGELSIQKGEPTSSVRDAEALAAAFPHSFGRPGLQFVKGSGPEDRRPLKVGVLLSGGQAPGGHNVIVGIHDALKTYEAGSTLVGFLGGPKGLLVERYRGLEATELERYRNTGGFDLIQSGRDKIESEADLAQSLAVCRKLELDGLVIIGGDDSNTNAAVLAEYFAANDQPTTVVGVPKTIDGDLKGGPVEISFGFDTATKVYSELIGNIQRDALSAGKYWHFVKLMGRAASHVTLECALQCRPNITLIGEEVEARNLTLAEIVSEIADIVTARAEAGQQFGVCLVPEGLIEFVPEISRLFAQLNQLLSEKSATFETLGSMAEKRAFVAERLAKAESTVFQYLPVRIQEQLLLDRDSHGNVQVSKIETEQLLSEQVAQELKARKKSGRYSGKFSVQHHFLGYEGRCAAPSNFDADYTYSLGKVAAALVAFKQSGYLSSVSSLAQGKKQAAGVPLTSLMQIEQRKGRPTPVIGKALVDLDGAPYAALVAGRERWAVDGAYRYPGPIQYFGAPEITNAISETLRLESEARG